MRGDLWFRKKARCFLSPGSCRRCRLKLFSSSSRFLLFLSLESIYHYSHFLFPFLLNSMCVCVCVCACVCVGVGVLCCWACVCVLSRVCVCVCADLADMSEEKQEGLKQLCLVLQFLLQEDRARSPETSTLPVRC